MKAGPVTKIRYRRVCEKPVDLLLNLGTRSKGTIYTCAEEPIRNVWENVYIKNIAKTLFIEHFFN